MMEDRRKVIPQANMLEFSNSIAFWSKCVMIKLEKPKSNIADRDKIIRKSDTPVCMSYFGYFLFALLDIGNIRA